jgi:hypothetical protein
MVYIKINLKEIRRGDVVGRHVAQDIVVYCKVLVFFKISKFLDHLSDAQLLSLYCRNLVKDLLLLSSLIQYHKICYSFIF